MTLTIGIAAWLTALALLCFVRRNAHDVDLPWAPLAEVLKHHAGPRREGWKVREGGVSHSGFTGTSRERNHGA